MAAPKLLDPAVRSGVTVAMRRWSTPPSASRGRVAAIWEQLGAINGALVVVAVIAMHGRGKGSGAPFDLLPYFVYEVRDGRIVRDRAFTSKAQALEAAGLSE